MTIEEIQKDKQQLENEISSMINEFQNKYKVIIQDINLLSEFNRAVNGELQKNIQVYIEITL